MRRGLYDVRLRELGDHLVETGMRTEGGSFKSCLFYAPESPDTIRLDRPIPNDKRSKTGKPTAFTMGQRYVASETLLTARTTSDLD